MNEINKWRKSGMNVEIEYDKDRAVQVGSFECAAFTAYNMWKDFFNELGINYKNVESNKMRYSEFKSKVHIIFCLLIETNDLLNRFTINKDICSDKQLLKDRTSILINNDKLFLEIKNLYRKFLADMSIRNKHEMKKILIKF